MNISPRGRRWLAPILSAVALVAMIAAIVLGMNFGPGGNGAAPQASATNTVVPTPDGTLSVRESPTPAPANVTMAHVSNAGEVVPLANDDILVTDMGNLDRTGGQVLIASRSGRLVWQYTGSLDIPHSAYPMPNGDILIADTGDNRVIEVNRKSEIVWNTDNLGGGNGRLGQGRLSDGTTLDYPNDAKPLSNGDILISLRLQNRVVEITRTGRIVWEVSNLLDRQHNPERLPNGDTLIADSDANRVIEVDPTGKHIVWQYSTGLSWPRDADLLANGDILIADSNNNRLIEVSRSGQLVNQWTGIPHVYSAAPLPNGDILVGDGSTYGVVELTPAHQIIWQLNRPSPSTASSTSSAPSPPPGQVLNGNFEQADSSDTKAPADWARNDALAYSLAAGQRADMTLDPAVHQSGRYSARISYLGDSNGIFYSQVLQVVPGHQYQFSGWIKTQDVTVCHPCSYGVNGTPGSTAEYELALYTVSGTSPPMPALPTHSGTSGWVQDTVQFTVPAGAKWLAINPTLRGQGTVWFDDVTLTDLGS